MTGAVLLALLPIVVLIVLGMALRHRGFLAESFWPQAERLGYYVLLPCLFFYGLATVQIKTIPVGMLSLTLILATLVVAMLVIALRPLMRIDDPAFTSVFQGSVRFNNYVGVTLAAGMFGANGIAMAAVCNAAIVPTVNVLCVLVFARYGAVKLTRCGILKQLTTNPLVVASLSGIAFHLLGLHLPPGLGPAIQTLGAASLPLGLLCVGAALEFHTARQWVGPVASSSAIKFLAMPVMTVALARLTGLQGPALTTALLFQALPTASSAYIMARQLGGDAPLMAGITAMQTVIALIALPMVLIGLSMVIQL
ncbi:AEC family transporter [Acetobacter orientalis]|uniref:AEC family transporter n=1 Tax=Acetobacter orientalis TaxID=146474 RepID=UPI0020A11F77|nr:AEC family transporter [Acetobacter orientalis]MCP1215802.1 AEC family transporter [Acetobacter orientalis]MCP1217345.1 AEC family transporter [Acetobacter orientalis]